MENPTPYEIESMMDAGGKGGEYLDIIGKTDLAALSQDEFMTFVETVCDGYIDGMSKRTRLWFREKEPPF